jgi:hypothetical protein
MTTDKRGVSALLIQRQLDLYCYEAAWMRRREDRIARFTASVHCRLQS